MYNQELYKERQEKLVKVIKLIYLNSKEITDVVWNKENPTECYFKFRSYAFSIDPIGYATAAKKAYYFYSYPSWKGNISELIEVVPKDILVVDYCIIDIKEVEEELSNIYNFLDSGYSYRALMQKMFDSLLPTYNIT